jgi:hypothetical protein
MGTAFDKPSGLAGLAKDGAELCDLVSVELSLEAKADGAVDGDNVYAERSKYRGTPTPLDDRGAVTGAKCEAPVQRSPSLCFEKLNFGGDEW